MKYEILLLPPAVRDLEWWKKNDTRVFHRIEALLTDISLHPFYGIGKPEALKWDLSGKWSRRITREHRVVYQVDRTKVYVYIFSLKYHYSI